MRWSVGVEAQGEILHQLVFDPGLEHALRDQGKAVARLQLPGLNAGKKMFEDSAMLGLLSRWITLGRRTKLACQSSTFFHARRRLNREPDLPSTLEDRGTVVD